MTFQRFMDQLFNGLDFVFIYIDNVLIASKSRKEQAGHLREVLRGLRAAGLVLNVPKCLFARFTVEFLGHQVSAIRRYLSKWRLSAYTPSHPTSRSFRVS